MCKTPSEFIVREAIDSDFKYLEDHLRNGDGVYLECSSLNLQGGYEQARYARIIEWSRKPIAIYGVNHFVRDIGSPWFLSTPDIKHIIKPLLRWAPTQVKLMHDYYPFLYNLVSAYNKRHIKCLKILGFHVAETWRGGLISFMRYK